MCMQATKADNIRREEARLSAPASVVGVPSNRLEPPPSPAAAPISQPAAQGAPGAPGTVAKPGMIASSFGSVSQAKQAQANSDASRIIK